MKIGRLNPVGAPNSQGAETLPEKGQHQVTAALALPLALGAITGMLLATASTYSAVGTDSVARLILQWGIAPLIGLNLGLAVCSFHPLAVMVCAVATLLACHGWRPVAGQVVDTGYSSGLVAGFLLSAVLVYLDRPRSRTGKAPAGRAPADESSVWIVIPTYNETENLRILLPRIRASFPLGTVLIVDDDSPDGTSGLVTEWMRTDDRLRLLTRQGVRGLDSALITGFDTAIAAGATVIVSMDADGSHDTEDIPRLVSALDDADIAIGSRYVCGGRTTGWPWQRWVLSRVANLYARSVLGLALQDCSGGFRAYRAEKWREASPELPGNAGYAFEEAILFLAQQHGAHIKEIPITFRERELGCSKLRTQEIWRGAAYLWRLRATRSAQSRRNRAVPAPSPGEAVSRLAQN